MPKYKRKVYFPMNKTEFIAKVAAKAGVEKKTAAALVDAALEVATDAMKEHEPISIVGFGTLSCRSFLLQLFGFLGSRQKNEPFFALAGMLRPYQRSITIKEKIQPAVFRPLAFI